jgi:hypothetical protein
MHFVPDNCDPHFNRSDPVAKTAVNKSTVQEITNSVIEFHKRISITDEESPLLQNKGYVSVECSGLGLRFFYNIFTDKLFLPGVCAVQVEND